MNLILNEKKQQKTVRLKLDDYLKKAEAENIYLKKVDHDLSDYITEANADAKYVTKTTGATHLTKTAATAKYLSKAGRYDYLFK